MESVPERSPAASRHWRLGWLALTGFVALGLVLEALHAFKVGRYLDPSYAVRRELFTLAHAHGVGLALVHLALGAYLERVPVHADGELVSRLLTVALALMPLGFFLGGLIPLGSEPGAGVWLVPIGGLSLLGGLGLLAAPLLRGRR